MKCRRCRIDGRVQGVSYRAAARRKAEELGLTGYARNLPDGSVEVLVCGEADAVERLCQWLWQGPRYAAVREVQCVSVDEEGPPDFKAI